MYNKLVKKFNINTYSMIKHGSVAVITLFGVGILFGIKNIMIAFPIALTSTVMGRQNFHVKTFNKAIKIILIDLVIVLTAYFSSMNIFWGIPINFFAIFLIMYTIVSPYDLTFYKPFIMLYVFTQYAQVSLGELPFRILSVIFGVLIVVGASYINRVNERSVLGKSMQEAFILINNQFKNILKEEYDHTIEDKCSKIMRDIAYKVYVTRHRRYLTTNLGKVQFQIFINVEYFNLYMIQLYGGIKNLSISKEYVEKLKEIVEDIIELCKDNIEFQTIKESTDNFIKEWSKGEEYHLEISLILENLLGSIKELNSIEKTGSNKVYKEWARADIDKTKVTFKEYFRPNTIRFKFAIRMAITLTIALLIGGFLGFYKIIWAAITIMSIMQPYYEDTIKKAKDRVIGNILGILFTGILINVADSQIITLGILVISLYLIYAFKEYYKISLFAAMASICIASLTENINVLILYRIVYVIIGVVVVVIVNRVVFPYRLKDGVEQLIDKIARLNKKLIEDSMEFLQSNKQIHEIRDLIIHSTLLCQKLYMRNLQYNDDEINKFIAINNKYVIQVGYKVLIVYGKNENVKKENIESILNLYEDFNNNIRHM
ncbi:MAG: FUSC family protein [Clostridium sulfidigenes]|uniref:FUSC family protein n=1 Tax=Clostridium sulfidigenes TaxID=318464 RepID=A0A927W8K8_9CLOT|nr:FUSC family protein [Clostridium sulfidigenes]